MALRVALSLMGPLPRPFLFDMADANCLFGVVGQEFCVGCKYRAWRKVVDVMMISKF